MSNINDKFAEVYAEWDPLVWNILRNKVDDGLLSSDMDDVHQEVWQAIWEKALEDGKYPIPQIASITRNKIADFQKQDIKKNTTGPNGMKQQKIPLNPNEETDGLTDDYLDPEDYFEKVVVNQRFQALMDKYPEGSKEKIFLDFYWDKAHAKDSKGKWIDPNKRYRDADLISQLGFAGTSDARWKKFRDRMRKEVADYFEYTPKEKGIGKPRGRQVRRSDT